MWWAVVTAPTVGYGDFSPSTAEGRIIGIAVMAMGIAFVSLLTAALAARFVRTDNSEMGGLRDTLTRIEAELGEIKAGPR
jgi:voltage-gated potassium channel